MKKTFSYMVLLLFVVLSYVGETSVLKAQVEYQTISLCKLCYESQQKGSTKCISCKKYNSLVKAAKICNDCYFKRGGLLERGCWICKANVVGGGNALWCSDCAKKDECIMCSKFLGSGDLPDESSGRKVVEKYTVKVTVPGKKEEFWKYWNSATAAYQKQNYEEALNYFKKCDEIIPDGPACQIGMCLRALERYDEAIKYFDIAIKDDPTFSDSYYNKGLAMAALGKMAEAEPLLKKAIDLNTQESYAYLLFALLRETNYKDFDQAIKYYEKGFELSPSTSKFRGNLINLYQQAGKFDDALRHTNITCELLDNNIESLNTKAELLFNFSKWNEAVPVYQKIISMNPNNVHIAYYFLGLCQYQIKEFENARDNWEKTIELDENKNPETYSCLAVCEMKLNNPADAKKYCEETINRISRESSFIYYNLTCAYSLMNELDKGLVFLEKALKTGQVNIDYMESDADLTNVRTAKKYKELVDKYRNSNLINTNTTEKKREETKEQKKEAAVDQKMEAVVKEPGNILVNETFNNNKTDFGLNNYWKLNNGMLTCSYGKKSILHSTRISEEYKDCTIEVNARWDERAKNYGFGIQFGYKGDEYYTFSISPDGHYKLSHWDGEGWNSLIPWTKTDLIKNGFNNLKVSCLGKNIYAYLNNNLVVNTKIDSFSGGKVGLVCSGDLNASFDDFVIYKN